MNRPRRLVEIDVPTSYSSVNLIVYLSIRYTYIR